ncbi:hypothetical protein T12_16331 [Trichinella patagoniensis]|uniref:Uncharacterized protein n=1 Tax=Trichinella patagoniensis TaxID=990121 RepID=A0A0V0ZX92_9BILA|nr:hypothetical protein T12_16331 [Trichinella patagoniensis]
MTNITNTELRGNTVLIVGRNYENLLYNKLLVRKRSMWNMGLYNLHHQAKKNQKLCYKISTKFCLSTATLLPIFSGMI